MVKVLKKNLTTLNLVIFLSSRHCGTYENQERQRKS